MFKCERKRRRCLIHIDGEMTIYNAASLKEQLVAVLDETGELEIELSGVTEIDSAGLQLLMLARQERQRRDLGLSLTRHSHAVLDAFELTGVASQFSDPIVLTR